jgi:hypothetical protein
LDWQHAAWLLPHSPEMIGIRQFRPRISPAPDAQQASIWPLPQTFSVLDSLLVPWLPVLSAENEISYPVGQTQETSGDLPAGRATAKLSAASATTALKKDIFDIELRVFGSKERVTE